MRREGVRHDPQSEFAEVDTIRKRLKTTPSEATLVALEHWREAHGSTAQSHGSGRLSAEVGDEGDGQGQTTFWQCRL